MIWRNDVWEDGSCPPESRDKPYRGGQLLGDGMETLGHLGSLFMSCVRSLKGTQCPDDSGRRAWGRELGKDAL